MGDSLLAIVHDDGSVRFLSQPKSHFVGWPMTRGEVAERLYRGTEMLPASAWVIAATDGLTDFVRGLTQTLVSAASSQASASKVVERLIDAACAGGAGDNVAVAAVRARGALEAVELSRPDVRMRIRGCLIGGAVGDALGAPVEFDSIERIRKRFGPRGITDYQTAYGRRGAITDDTQMSLFTAEGLVRAYVRGETKGLCHPPSVVDHAYARWLATQGESSSRWDSTKFDGWLLTNRGLHNTRSPGNTCLSALRASRMGTIDDPLNDSKGCGAVMRAAPIGLLGRNFPGDRFELGCDIGALTHGHPSGYLAAGALAEIITTLVWSDATLQEAVDHAAGRLRWIPRHEETLQALEDARALAASDIEPSADAVELLGEGWGAEEALAIGVYCALVACDFEHAVLLAVNHSGDSDSTGAIAGNILGSLRGYNEIPAQWTYDLELHEVIEPLCRDWNALFTADPEFSTDPLPHPQIETPPVEFWARPVGLHRSSRVPEDRAGRHARIVEGPARGRTRIACTPTSSMSSRASSSSVSATRPCACRRAPASARPRLSSTGSGIPATFGRDTSTFMLRACGHADASQTSRRRTSTPSGPPRARVTHAPSATDPVTETASRRSTGLRS